jgi:hypothetical protein
VGAVAVSVGGRLGPVVVYVVVLGWQGRWCGCACASRTGGSVVWVFPNLGIALATLLHLMEERAYGSIVLEKLQEPLQPVEARFRAGIGGERALELGEVEKRTRAG